MNSLINTLYKNNVIINYYGYIDTLMLNQILKITQNNLSYFKESVVVTKRIYNAINECVENIIKHNFFPAEDMLHYKSLLLIVKHKDHYQINTINVINENQKNKIIHQFENVLNKSKEELKEIKANIISNKQYSEVATAGLGLVDMVIKTDGCNIEFNNYQNNYLFNINFKINSKAN